MPAIQKVCEDTGIKHAPNVEACRRRLDNPDYYVRDWEVDEYNALPFYDALNLYKKFCKKYLVDMRMFKRPRKEERQEKFGKRLENDRELSSFVEDNDRLIEQRHQEIKYRFEKIIPKLWEALSSRAEFKELEVRKANRFKTWEKLNFDENDEALRRLREYLKIPPTIMQRQDVHGPSVCEMVKSRSGMRKLLKEGHPYTEPDLKRLRRVHKGNRSVGKILGLLEGEVENREEEIQEFDLDSAPYNSLTEEEMRALYAWGKNGQRERTQKWRRELQRRIRKMEKNEPQALQRSHSTTSTSSLESVLAPGELFAQVEEEMRLREQEEREEEMARSKSRGGKLQQMLEGLDSDSDDEEEREPRRAQLPMGRPTLNAGPLDESKKAEVEERLLAAGVIERNAEEELEIERKDAEDSEGKLGSGSTEEEEEEHGLDEVEAESVMTSSFSTEEGQSEAQASNGLDDEEEEDEEEEEEEEEGKDGLGGEVTTGELDEDEHRQLEEEKEVDVLEEKEKEQELQTGEDDETGMMPPVVVEEEDEEEQQLHAKRIGELSPELALLEPVRVGEEDEEEGKSKEQEEEEHEEDQQRRRSMFGRLAAFMGGFRRKSSGQPVSGEGEKERTPVVTEARQPEQEEEQLKVSSEESGEAVGLAAGGKSTSGPVFRRPKASTRRLQMPTASEDLEETGEAPTNVLTTGRIFELAAQGKIAESAHAVLDSWSGQIDWDAYLKGLGFIRLVGYSDADTMKAHFGKNFRIVMQLAELCERKVVDEDTQLSLAEDAQLVTHNGKEMMKICRFEHALDSAKAGNGGRKLNSRVTTEEQEGTRLEEETTMSQSGKAEEGGEETEEEAEIVTEKKEEEFEGSEGGGAGLEVQGEEAQIQFEEGLEEEEETGEAMAQSQERLGSTQAEVHSDGRLEEERRKVEEENEDELGAMPPPKPRLGSSTGAEGSALLAGTQLEPPGGSSRQLVSVEEEGKSAEVSAGKNLDAFSHEISSDVSLVHAAKSFELGLLGKLAREAVVLLEANEWNERVQWDEYFENMKLWRVKDLKDRAKVRERFKNEASVINALVIICEQAVANHDSLTRSQQAALGTHNGKELMDVFEFDRKFEEFLQKQDA